MEEALRMARLTAPANPDILCLHLPPIGMADVSVPQGAGGIHVPNDHP
ncbi:MAG: hypothetical protein FJ104_12740 [Deltaproteobacteria bacterium]|nr:hypothetical protein [Deltaproteobacteria bacterium]